MVKFASLLTPEQVERTHQASLEILEQVGILVHNSQSTPDIYQAWLQSWTPRRI